MNVHDFSVTTADGGTAELGDYAGRRVLIVNVASRCGLTPQYTGLEELHRDTDVTVLGFPCNQFGAQEPGTNDEIQTFCSTTYGVTFPVFAKVDVNGDGADPLWKYLREQQPGDIEWNFTKFLVGADGEVEKRFGPRVTPEEIRAEL